MLPAHSGWAGEGCHYLCDKQQDKHILPRFRFSISAMPVCVLCHFGIGSGHRLHASGSRFLDHCGEAALRLALNLGRRHAFHTGQYARHPAAHHRLHCPRQRHGQGAHLQPRPRQGSVAFGPMPRSGTAAPGNSPSWWAPLWGWATAPSGTTACSATIPRLIVT